VGAILQAFLKNIYGASPGMKVMRLDLGIGRSKFCNQCAIVARVAMIAIVINVDGMMNRKWPKFRGDNLRSSCLSMEQHGE